MIAITNHANHVWEKNTHNSLVQLAGLSMRWPSFSSLNSSSTGIPGYGEPPSVKISHIKTPNDHLEETKTHSSDHFPSRTHSKHVPLVVHITLSISVLTVNTVRVYQHATEMLNNQHFVQLFKGATHSSLFCGTITSLSQKFGWGTLCEMKPKIQIWSIYSGDICWRQQRSSCWGLNAVFLRASQTVGPLLHDSKLAFVLHGTPQWHILSSQNKH